jgi:CubicO group peptidase (beta-lactamase class C family)
MLSHVIHLQRTYPRLRLTVDVTVAILLLITTTVVGGFAQAAPVNTVKAGMDPDRLARIQDRMKSYVERGTIAGVVTLVARHGTIASLEAVGYQDLESKKLMKTDTIFQIMSMTKPVTAVAVMMLVEEGRVVLSSPVEKYLPEFKGLWLNEPGATNKERRQVRPSRLITLRDLLTHTSGMIADPPAGADDLLLRMHLSLGEAVTLYSQQPLDFEPGSRWQYSNPGIATLGRIVEVVSGRPFEKFLEDRIFKPLGMKDSFIFPPPEKIDRMAMVYNLDNGQLKRAGREILAGDPATFRKGARYSGPEYGVCSTATDLAIFYQMMLNGGIYNGNRLLSKEGVGVMTSLHTGTIDPAGHSPGKGYGLAWSVVKDSIGTLQYQSIGTFGHGGAFGTEGWIDPKKDLVGVFLIQRSSGGDGEEANVFKALAAAAIVEK